MSDDEALAGLPPHESDPLRQDLPIVREWAHTVGPPAQVTVDRRRFDAGQGHVLLVVTVAGDAETARRQLVPRLYHPDRLRVRIDRPGDDELRRALQWVLDTHMTHTRGSHVTGAGIDDRAGVVRVTLNRSDPALAARLEAHGSGLIRVSSTPVVPVFPEDAPGG
jgi:hypothetical protein